MPVEYILKGFLEEHRTEVRGMLLTEYNEAETMEMFKEEGRAEGVLNSLTQMVKNLHLTIEQAMDALEIPQSERHKYKI